MPFNVKSTLEKVQSYLQASGHVVRAQISEPKQPPGERIMAAVYMGTVSVAQLTLQTTIELHVVRVRLYMNMLREAGDEIEFGLAQALSEISADLLGDYDLGATVRNVDVGGIYGTPLSATWGYVDVGGTMYRVVDITLPLIVDDSATLVA